MRSVYEDGRIEVVLMASSSYQKVDHTLCKVAGSGNFESVVE